MTKYCSLEAQMVKNQKQERQQHNFQINRKDLLEN